MEKKLLTADTLKEMVYLSGLSASPDGTCAAFVRTKAEEETGEFLPELVLYRESDSCAGQDSHPAQPDSHSAQCESSAVQPDSHPAQCESSAAQPDSHPAQADSCAGQPDNHPAQTDSYTTRAAQASHLQSLGEGKAPSWSPDGKNLAFLCRKTGEYQIWLWRASESEARQITTARHGVRNFSWSPDGTGFVFEAPFWPEELTGGLMFAEFAQEQKQEWLQEREMAPQVIEEIAYKRDEFFGVEDGSVSCICQAGVDGKQTLLTDGKMNCYRPVMSPDGQTVVYYGRPYHDAKAFSYEIFSRTMTDSAAGQEAGCKGEGEERQLTDGKGEERQHTSGKGEERQLTSGIMLDADVSMAFLPGKPELIYSAYHMGEKGFDLRPYRMPLTGGESLCLFPEKEDGTCHSMNNFPVSRTVYGEESPYFRIDQAGEWVYFLSAFHGRESLYRAAADGSGKVETVLEGEFSLHSFSVPENGRMFVTAGDPVTVAELYRADLSHGGCGTIAETPDLSHGSCGTIAGDSCPSASDCVRAGMPPVQGRGGLLTRLTWSNNWMEDYEVSAPRELWFDSADGKTKIQGWILMPPGWEQDKTYPAVLDIHGGPECTYVNDFWHEFQAFAAAGMAVLWCNPRGSTGYGQEFTNDACAWGEEAVSDLLALIDRAAERFPIDTGCLGVTGGSYGGFMTVKLISTTDRFKAAAAQRCLCNLATSYGTGDIGFESAKTEDLSSIRMLDVLTKRARNSLIRKVDDIHVPLLILHGYKDYRCGFEQAEQLFISVKERHPELPVRMVVYLEENHGVTRTGKLHNQISHLNEMVRWFSMYL